MSGHAQAAKPSQLPYIIGLQCSASHTLHQELPKSTYLLRTLITCRNQHSLEQSKGKKPAILSADRMGLNNPRTNKKCTLPTCQALQLYISQRTYGKIQNAYTTKLRRAQRRINNLCHIQMLNTKY
ncbi:hypothetical protein FHG87_022692 [Trinorchestia longiramus]|nr:hypothetical protein FHG87_022692 [Trinorchestia longiramus]